MDSTWIHAVDSKACLAANEIFSPKTSFLSTKNTTKTIISRTMHSIICRYNLSVTCYICCYFVFISDNICVTLSDAISRGNAQFAGALAQQLAAQKAMVKIRLDNPENDELSKGAKDNKIKFVYKY